ncbi:sulfatase-like hydrolase/transferase [Spelaeicoccus albus]|uniref:Arylsulfatase A-like enzyme n=1 Tax=Spelaeicoccus albus TaxID=1280376 RepID=A0A7Z0D1W0_9MICO|nr:sulfatase-like hydrolase/transferase [Spelaeicoccus albus]NYI66985.1 arylsulfatase A-like enzyme [Spelaeicoccus albus]
MTNERRRPNVVIIYADDLGWGDLGCFGADDLHTPHLDALSASGVRLPNWYANSPVCSPSRAALLTGRYPAEAGVEAILGGSRRTAGLPDQPTIASELKRRGWSTAIFGKWHLGVEPSYSPTHRGFDTHFGFRAGCVDYYSHIYYWGDENPLHDLWQDDDEVWMNGEYLTSAIARRASDYIEEHAAKPFFAYVPFNAPHYPLHAPDEYVERFAHLPEGRRMMAAMIAAMDDGVGQIVETLERLGLRDDTLVFMSSDNGPSIEERNWLNGEEVSYTGGSAGGLRGHKGSLFEGGIRVPAMLSWPARIPAGQDSSVVGSMMDLLPTILHAVDGDESEILEGFSGQSVLNSLIDGETGPDRRIFWEYEGQTAMRHGRWKVVLDVTESMKAPVAVREGVFDLEADPHETQNLRDAAPEILRDGRERIADWKHRIDAVSERHDKQRGAKR